MPRIKKKMFVTEKILKRDMHKTVNDYLENIPAATAMAMAGAMVTTMARAMVTTIARAMVTTMARAMVMTMAGAMARVM